MSDASTLPTATSFSASQGSTQTPQAATAASGFSGGQSSSSVQPGTNTTLLNSTSGTQLSNTGLSTIPLTTTATGQTQPLQPTRHVNGGLIAVALLLFVVAAALFYATSVSSKTTTETL